MKQHILIVGLPGAGKTTVGRMVAEQLGTDFVDTDVTITRKMQMPITRIFAVHGEARFREMERQEMRAALDGPPSVIAPGGGWAAQPGQLEAARSSSFVIYLKTMVTTATNRASGEHTRPILLTEDPVAKMRDLLKEREPFYQLADVEVKNDRGNPAAAVEEIVRQARERAGW